MQVAMYYNNNDVRLEEMPKPAIGPGELLVKVEACGICGSDVMEWYRSKKAPLVLGHEASGEIVEVGEGVERFKTGDRVFVSHHVPCNKCHYCLNDNHTACQMLHTTNFYPGGFAQYIRVPSPNVDQGTFLLPSEVSFDEATFIEPLACVVRAQRMVQFKAGQSLLVLGAGISGLLHILLAKATGAGPIIATDVNKYRLKAAKEFGADVVLEAQEDVLSGVRKVCEDRGADLVIVCTQALPAFKQALKSVDRAGTILFFAPTEPGVTIDVPVNDFWRNNIKIMHSYGNSPRDANIAIELIRSGKVPVAKMITHRLSLKQAGLGFSLVVEGKDSVKVIIQPHRS